MATARTQDPDSRGTGTGAADAARGETARGETAAAEAGGRNNSASLRRAIAILLHLAEDRDVPGAATDLSLGELSEALSMNKSTLLRLIAPLCDARLVEQNPDTGRYRLGWRTAQLGQVYLERLDPRDAAHDVLRGLMIESGETAHLVLADLPEVVYIDKVEALQPVRMYSRIGSRQSAYCTGVGKALLAHADDATVRAAIAAGLPPRTPNTLTTAARLRADLAAIRERGYSIDDVENEPDIRCVGAPIFDHTGTARYAVSISGPATRVTPDRVPDLGRAVATAAAEISRRLGPRWQSVASQRHAAPDRSRACQPSMTGART